MLALPRAAAAQTATANGAIAHDDRKMILGMLVFDGFQLLDVFGPLEMTWDVRHQVRIIMLGERGASDSIKR